MFEMETDYLVVGAGLAGSIAGFLLRQSGASVLAIELRDAHAKDKLCAGFMSADTMRAIKAFYGPDAPSCVGASDMLPWHWRSGGLEYLPKNNGLLVLNRKSLDDYCLARFRDAGGNVRDRTRLVRVDDRARRATCMDVRTKKAFAVRYKELIGADGALSSVRRLLTGGSGRAAVSFEGIVPALRRRAVTCAVEPDVSGYSWYAPRGESDATVGCFYPTLDAAEGKRRLGRFCSDMGIDAPQLRGAPIPSGDDILLRAGEHAWLIGDAAGLIDASTGGGIHYALDSACLLASSFVGGAPYEEAMAPTLARLAAIASHVDGSYQWIWSAILLRGLPVAS